MPLRPSAAPRSSAHRDEIPGRRGSNRPEAGLRRSRRSGSAWAAASGRMAGPRRGTTGRWAGPLPGSIPRASPRQGRGRRSRQASTREAERARRRARAPRGGVPERRAGDPSGICYRRSVPGCSRQMISSGLRGGGWGKPPSRPSMFDGRNSSSDEEWKKERSRRPVSARRNAPAQTENVTVPGRCRAPIDAASGPRPASVATSPRLGGRTTAAKGGSGESGTSRGPATRRRHGSSGGPSVPRATGRRFPVPKRPTRPYAAPPARPSS